MELGLVGSGLWMTPEVSDYTEILKTYACASCNLKKERNKFSTVSDDERICKQCSKRKIKECDEQSCLNINNTLLRVCSGCQIKKGKKRFVKEEFDRPDMERKCKSCMPNTDPNTIQAKRVAEVIPPESNKKQKS
eukprot:scaffold51832_cov57-Attheya_sp.AAC.7